MQQVVVSLVLSLLFFLLLHCRDLSGATLRLTGFSALSIALPLLIRCSSLHGIAVHKERAADTEHHNQLHL